MTGGCASLPALDEKFMRRPNENQRAALKTRLPRGEIYFRLRHTARRRDHYYCVQEQLENLCTGTHCEPQRGRNKFMVVGLAGCACLQHFSSADLCGGCPEFQFARRGPQILMRELHNGRTACAKTRAT